MHSSTRTRSFVGAGILTLTLIAAGCASDSGDRATPTTSASAPTASNGGTAAQESLRSSMRKLWEDHITWTRLFIIAAEAGSPDTDATAKRLLQNQADIGNAIAPIYGDAAGARLTELLTDHILVAGDLITAAKAGDAASVATAKDKWYANADQIAEFLSAANPTNWPAAEVQSMMHDHLDNTLAEAVDHLQGNFTADIADYDRIHEQILHMADMLSNGIIAQHPELFA